MEIKRIDNNLVLYDGDEQIETYELGKEIDFSKLVNFLIEKDFETPIVLSNTIEDKTEQEQNIVSFVEKIVEDYNKKTEKYKLFLSELAKKE